MKKGISRILSCLLTIVMIASSLPVTAYAAEDDVDIVNDTTDDVIVADDTSDDVAVVDDESDIVIEDAVTIEDDGVVAVDNDVADDVVFTTDDLTPEESRLGNGTFTAAFLEADYYVAGGSYTYKGDMSETQDHKYKNIFSGVYNDIQVERHGGRFFTGEEIVSLSGYGDTTATLNEITAGAIGGEVTADTIAASGKKVNFEVHDIPAEFVVDKTVEWYDDETGDRIPVELNDETLIRKLYAWEYEQDGTTGIYHRVSSQEITSDYYSFNAPELGENDEFPATVSGNVVVDTSKLKAGKITTDNVIAIVAYMYDASQDDSLFNGDWEYNDDRYFYALEQVEFESNRYFDVTEDDYYSDRTPYYDSDIYLKSEMGSFSVAAYAAYRRDDKSHTLTLYDTANQPNYGLMNDFMYGWRSKDPGDYLLGEWVIPAKWTDPLTGKVYDVRLGEIGYFYAEDTGEKMYIGGRRYPILASGVVISYGVGFPDDCTQLLTTGHSKLEMMCVTSITIECGPNGEKVGSNIKDMNSMFYGNTYGNMGNNVPVTMLNSLDVSALDTSNVTDMSRMFYAQWVTGSGPDVSGFDTSKVTDMSYMFYDAHISNPDVSHFNTSNVTDMAYMFGAAGVWTDFRAKPHAYAQGVYTSLDLSSFDFGRVDSMAGMFLNQKNLASIKFPDNMDTSHVRDMSELFMSCSSLTLEGAENLTLLDTSSVVDMFGMFGTFHWRNWGAGDKRVLGNEYTGYYNGYVNRGCYQSHSNGSEADERGPAFTSLDLSTFKNFDTSKVQNMALMFDLPEVTQLSFGSKFDTSRVVDMNRMFNLPKMVSLDISSFNTGSLTDSTMMFDLDTCTSLTLGSGFDLSKINEGKSGGMFSTPVLPALDLSGVNFGDNADALSSSSIAYFNLGYMESGCYELEELRLPANMPVFNDPAALPETMYDEGGDEHDAVYGGNTEALTLTRASDPLKTLFGFYIDGQDSDKLVSETTIYADDEQDNMVYLKLKMDPQTPMPYPSVSYTLKGYSREGVEYPANYVATVYEGNDGVMVYANGGTLPYGCYVVITANVRRSDGVVFTASCRVNVEKSQNQELTLRDNDGNEFTCYTNNDGTDTVTIKILKSKGGTQSTLKIGKLTGDGKTYTVTRIGAYAFHYTISSKYFTTAYYPYGQSAGKVFTDIVLDESVKAIGEYAFDPNDTSSSSVTSFSGPGVEEIGDHAFNDMVALTTVNLPKVKRLGCGVFSNTTSITNLTLNPSIENWNNGVLTDEFGKDSALTEFTIPSCISEIGERGLPLGITALNNIPSTVTRIGYHALANYYNLQSVTIPATVTVIGEGAFEDCESLETVTFTDAGNLTKIGDYAFNRCKSLTSISFPDTVTDFGKGVVMMLNDNTSALTTVKLPKNINEVPDETFFGCGALTSVTLPDNIVRIGTDAFRSTPALTSFTIPETVTKLGDNVFYESGITSMEFPEGITVIPAGVCYQCEHLTSVTFKGAVTEIGTSTEGAAAGMSFEYCTSLASINLPDTLTYLGRYSFCSCFSLEGNISIPQGVTVIDEYAFAGTAITGITMPDAVTSIKQAAFKDCEQLTNVGFSVNTQDIGTDAFRNCKNLEIVALPVGIKNIGWYAFLNVGYDKGHAEVYLPNTVESVGYLAFQGLGGGDKAYILYGGSEDDEKKIRFTGGETSLWLSYTDDHGVSYNTGWNVTDAGVKYVPHEVKYATHYFVEKDDPMKDTVSVVQDYGTDLYGFDEQGYRYENTSAVIDGTLYYFDEHGRGTAASSGYSAGTTGIVEISDGVFVYVKNGSVQKASPAELLAANIITIDGKKYLLTGSGVLATGFIPDDSAYTASSAEYGITGWYFDDNTAELSWVKKTDAQGNDTYYGADYTTPLTGTYPNEDGELVKYSNGHCALLTGLKVTDEEGTEISRITLYKGPDSGTAGKPDTATIKLVTLPEDVTIDPVPTVTWSIINNNPKKKGDTVITEASHTDGQIIVNANAPGRAKVRVNVRASVEGGASVSYTKDCLVIVEDTNVYPTSVTITGNTASIKVEATMQLDATISPENATAGTAITWSSSDRGIATVSDSGLVTGISPGNVVITASTENGIKATVSLTVIDKYAAQPKGVSVFPGELTLTSGSYETIYAVVTPEDADQTVTWVSDHPEIADVDGAGVVTAISAGTAKITARTVNNKTAVCTVKVVQPPTAVEITGPSTVAAKKTIQLVATVLPDKAFDKKVIWSSSDTSKATVDQKGKVTGVAPGTATIRAESNYSPSIYDEVEVTVTLSAEEVHIYTYDGEASNQRGTDVTKQKVGLDADETDKNTIKLTAGAFGKLADGNLSEESVSQELTWKSSKETVAAIEENTDGSVTVTAVGQGSTTITATTTDGTNKSASVTVDVTRLVQTIEVKGPDKVGQGKSIVLTAGITPDSATNRNVTWSVTDNLTEGQKQALADAKVKNPITIDGKGKLSVHKNVPSGTRINVTAAAADGSLVVSPAYEVTVLAAAGQMLITDETDANIAGGTVTLDLSTTGQTVIKGVCLEKDAEDSVENRGMVSQSLTYTNGNVKVIDLTVNNDGTATVTALAPGKAGVSVTASDGSGVKSTVNFVVVRTVTGITVSGPDEVAAGKAGAYTATVEPENATNKKLTWGFSGTDAVKWPNELSAGQKADLNSRIAKLISIGTGNGKLSTGKDVPAGTEIRIMATAQDQGHVSSAEKTVTVKKPADKVEIHLYGKEDASPVTGMKFGLDADVYDDPSTPDVDESNNTLLLSAVANAGDADVSQGFIWSSNKKNIADVDENGKVTALSGGTATITATAADGTGKKASVTVYVSTQITGITINGPADNKIAAGGSMELSAAIVPEAATTKDVEWMVLTNLTDEQKEELAKAKVREPVSIDRKKGKLTVNKAVPVGTEITVKAKSTDGSYVTDSYELIVSSATTAVELRYGSEVVTKEIKNPFDRSSSEEITLTAACKPEGALQRVTWKSSNEATATVDNGKVKLCKPGTCTITASALDGSGKSAAVKITVVQSKVTVDGPNEVAAGKSIALTAMGPKVNWDIKDIQYTNSFNPETQNVKNPITVKGGKVSVNAKVPAGTTFTVAATSAVKGDEGNTCDREITVTRGDADSVGIYYVSSDAAARNLDGVNLAGKKLGIDRGVFEETSQSLRLQAAIFDKAGSDEGFTSEVQWTTGNPKVASIVSVEHEEVLIKVLSSGTAVLTATALDGSGKKASVTLNVANLVQYLTIKTANGNDTAEEMYAGKTLQFSVDQMAPSRTAGKKVTWSAEYSLEKLTEAQKEAFNKLKNPITINTGNGKLSVSKDVPAKTLIYVKATSADGGYVDSNIIIITVAKLAGRVALFDMTEDTTDLAGAKLGIDRDEVGSGTRTVKAVLYDSTAADASTEKVGQDVIWTISAPAVASISENDDGTVTITAHKAGTAKLTATATDGSKKSVSLTISVASLVKELEISGADTDTIDRGTNMTYSVTKIGPARANDKNVVWSVSDNLTDEQKKTLANAKVKNPITIDKKGKLTVHKDVPTGTVITVTARAADGSLVNAIKKVTVN